MNEKLKIIILHELPVAAAIVLARLQQPKEDATLRESVASNRNISQVFRSIRLAYLHESRAVQY